MAGLQKFDVLRQRWSNGRNGRYRRSVVKVDWKTDNAICRMRRVVKGGHWVDTVGRNAYYHDGMRGAKQHLAWCKP